MQAKLFAIISSVIILGFVLELIRRQKMTFRYSITWLGTSVLALIFALFPSLLFKISEAAGFILPSNFVFFLFHAFFIVVCLLLTIYVNEQNQRTEKLTQTLAALEYELKFLKEKK